ncbi:MAG: sulfite exporter TauE/SafE family protein [Pirellulales bacterium]
MWNYLLLLIAAMVGGAVNAVAGGGTLLTFPALLWAGQLEIVANATSTVALWPGAASSFWGYRGELRSSRREILVLAVPSFVGGVVGAVLLTRTSNTVFAAVVPYLILLATCLFVVQEPLARWLRRRAEQPDAKPAAASAPGDADRPRSTARWIAVLTFQLLVGVYGGYFGAGIGILMLAAFGFLGFKNIHHMNALKNLNGMCINGVAAVLFIAKGLVDWRLAALMAAGAIVGGYAGAGTARRVGQKRVRRAIIAIGLALSIWLFVRQTWLV